MRTRKGPTRLSCKPTVHSHSLVGRHICRLEPWKAEREGAGNAVLRGGRQICVMNPSGDGYSNAINSAYASLQCGMTADTTNWLIIRHFGIYIVRAECLARAQLWALCATSVGRHRLPTSRHAKINCAGRNHGSKFPLLFFQNTHCQMQFPAQPKFSRRYLQRSVAYRLVFSRYRGGISGLRLAHSLFGEQELVEKAMRIGETKKKEKGKSRRKEEEENERARV